MDQLVRKDSTRIIEKLAGENERFAGKSVLLTGSAGFLGMQFLYYFAQLNDAAILSKPVRVCAVDNLMRGEPEWLHGYQDRDDFIFVKADVAAGFHPKAQYDFIIHAASVASPSYYRRYPIETMDANVQGLRRLLDHAVEYPAESMLFFSSSEVYGDPLPEYIPTSETYTGNVSCVGPRACYDESKRYGETLCVNFERVHGVPVKIVRPFNNYGPGLRMSDGRVIPDFFRDVLLNQNVVVFSDGAPTRTFCYVSDAMTGYLFALLSDDQGGVFNIGSDKPEISMKDLAEMVIRVSGKSLKVIHKASSDPLYLEDSPNRRCPDISKARRVLRYEPEVNLEDGLLHTYRWYLENAETLEA